MEQIFDEEQHKYMDEAFNKFIHDSDIIVALLTKDGSKDGVGWKIGFMQGVDFLSEKFKIRKRRRIIQIIRTINPRAPIKTNNSFWSNLFF